MFLFGRGPHQTRQNIQSDISQSFHHSLSPEKMAARNLLRRSLSFRRFSTTISSTRSPPLAPSPPPPDFMIYDRLAESVKSKVSRLENPDPRFLRYTSPHPVITDHTAILSSPETRITTLPNGLRVATESNLAASTASIGVWIDAGSRFEREEVNGVSNLLNRLVLKGKGDSARVWEELENIGGELNGFANREMTGYYLNLMNNSVAKGIEILGDIFQNSSFSESVISHERESIIREREKVADVAEEVVLDHLHSTAFQYTPLGKSVIGSLNTLKSITNADIQEYISNQYSAHRMVIAASGAVKHEDVVEQVKKAFTKLSANPNTTLQLVNNEPASFTGSEVRIIDDDMPLARFAVAFNGASCQDFDSIALMVLGSMLGSWSKNDAGGIHSGSHLVQRAAINGIAEEIKAFNINYKDAGLFGVYAVAKPDGIDDLAYAIMYEISKLAYRVSEVDVTRACNQLKSNLLLHNNGGIGRQLLNYGRRIPSAELFARIDAVDANTVRRVAERFLVDKDIAIAAMGPVQGLPDYNWFRRRTYWLRY